MQSSLKCPCQTRSHWSGPRCPSLNTQPAAIILYWDLATSLKVIFKLQILSVFKPQKNPAWQVRFPTVRFIASFCWKLWARITSDNSVPMSPRKVPGNVMGFGFTLSNHPCGFRKFYPFKTSWLLPLLKRLFWQANDSYDIWLPPPMHKIIKKTTHLDLQDHHPHSSRLPPSFQRIVLSQGNHCTIPTMHGFVQQSTCIHAFHHRAVVWLHIIARTFVHEELKLHSLFREVSVEFTKSSFHAQEWRYQEIKRVWRQEIATNRKENQIDTSTQLQCISSYQLGCTYCLSSSPSSEYSTFDPQISKIRGP